MDALEKLRSMDEYMHTEQTEERPHADVLTGTGARSGALPACGRGGETSQADEQFRKAVSFPVHFAALPNGRHIPLLKTALTSACERNCTYCAFRSGRDFRRQTFQPDEMAKVFMQLHSAGVVQGLFLSSGVAGGGCRTQDRLLATAEILRKRYAFKGYIHLKIMPGAEMTQVERGMHLADRVSVNLEAPTTDRLRTLAPEKKFLEELLEPLKWVQQIRQNQPANRAWNQRWPSSTTQFVVGAVEETDMELLQITSYLHAVLRLARVYFSGFAPVRDTPLENRPGVNPTREVRLYQASFLLRDYGFDFEELSFSPQGNLSLETDPKLAWARTNLQDKPLEINTADYAQLLRIPGIGPEIAKRIIEQRRYGSIGGLGSLRKMGVTLRRAAPFILINGAQPAQQMQFPFIL